METAPATSPQRVFLVPYDDRWPAAFTREGTLIADAIGVPLSAIQHIGSTAIPGLCAKPIIDLLAAVPDLTELDTHSARLQALGYEVMGEFGIPGRRYFRKNDPTGQRTHQLHAFALGSPQIARHLAFRDFLRAHPVHTARYATLKQQLAALHPTDISRYTDGKDEFIAEIDARAAAWRKTPLPRPLA